VFAQDAELPAPTANFKTASNVVILLVAVTQRPMKLQRRKAQGLDEFMSTCVMLTHIKGPEEHIESLRDLFSQTMTLSTVLLKHAK
jgi:hypothetical protein